MSRRANTPPGPGEVGGRGRTDENSILWSPVGGRPHPCPLMPSREGGMRSAVLSRADGGPSLQAEPRTCGRTSDRAWSLEYLAEVQRQSQEMAEGRHKHSCALCRREEGQGEWPVPGSHRGSP